MGIYEMSKGNVLHHIQNSRHIHEKEVSSARQYYAAGFSPLKGLITCISMFRLPWGRHTHTCQKAETTAIFLPPTSHGWGSNVYRTLIRLLTIRAWCEQVNVTIFITVWKTALYEKRILFWDWGNFPLISFPDYGKFHEKWTNNSIKDINTNCIDLHYW